MRLLLKYLLFILLPAYTYGQSGRPDAGITFEVTDSLHNPLAYATVVLTPMSGGGKAYATTTDEEGRARFTLPANTYNADISYIGYVSQRMEVRPVSGSDMLRTVRLRTSDTQIREVVITATQVRRPVSGVHIGRDAMNHIQPSSFRGPARTAARRTGLRPLVFLLEPHSSARDRHLEQRLPDYIARRFVRHGRNSDVERRGHDIQFGNDRRQ